MRLTAIERMSILETRAACGSSAEHTARTFQITTATVASWMKRLDEKGSGALVQICEPVNRFPEFVRYAVQQATAHSLWTPLLLIPAASKQRF